MTDFAKLSELKIGSKVKVTGFDCMNRTKAVDKDGGGFYVPCDAGKHYLSGQILEDGDSLTGIFHA